jgi:hypothetical protein
MRKGTPCFVFIENAEDALLFANYRPEIFHRMGNQMFFAFINPHPDDLETAATKIAQAAGLRKGGVCLMAPPAFYSAE